MVKCAICRVELGNDGRKISWFNKFFVICKKCAKPMTKDQKKSINYYVWFLEIGGEILNDFAKYKRDINKTELMMV